MVRVDPDSRASPIPGSIRDTIPGLSIPDGLVRIIAAYVNDVRTPEHETVTLLNTADVPVTLDGWMIADKQKNRMNLSGSIAAGMTMVVPVVAPVALSNKGGIITLLNAQGIKVHGVSYTKSQASQPGRTDPVPDLRRHSHRVAAKALGYARICRRLLLTAASPLRHPSRRRARRLENDELNVRVGSRHVGQPSTPVIGPAFTALCYGCG